MRRSFALAPAVTAAILCALLLAGCTAGNESSSTSGTVPVQGAPEPGVGDTGLADGGTTSEVNTASRDVVTSGSMSVTVADPITTAQSAVTLTERAGGRVDSRSENPATDNQAASASLTLRIPSDELERTLTELKALGTVNFVSINGTDVTQQSTDLDARITALQTSVDRLLTLMSTASDTADLISIEGALSSRQAELESLVSQRNLLSDQIDYATITLDLLEDGTVAPSAPGDFWGGVVVGWTALMATVGAVVVAVGVALPWIVTLAFLALIVVLIVRLFTRRRKAA
ncbi:DUF4349 domain-containing protein [Cryobacterium sp. CG_9.6]|uniref:DUF4349 domain-containing protein n=1 Tax=Cryobacterium sp. CG_9.6 TaxID=2760710 RepID=UPI002475A387|nr:DUF4349 domain-containing protein [Cryobacterium sp. CG_9.6]MDH6237751.1 hypothetical protein [Cryobacterium sp. CG_9.6]